MQLTLAEAYFARNKHSAAFVVVEELLKHDADHAAAHLLHARLLLATGQPADAREAYEQALALNPGLADRDLGQQLEAAVPALAVGVGVVRVLTVAGEAVCVGAHSSTPIR